MKNILKVIIPLAVFLILLIVSFFSFNNENNVYHGIYDSNKNYFETDTAIAIMYETDNGNYEVSDGTNWLLDGYRFNETLSGCENGGTISWNDATQKVEMKTNISDKCYVYFDIYNPTFAEYIINSVYTTDGENGLYYHDGVGSYTNANQEAGDNSYRYAGTNPNNYVCFGSDAISCPTDNLYRIIGIFGDQVKLIKSTRYGENHAWDSGNSNVWDATTKPDIYTTLNTTYYNTLRIKWQNLIAEAIWQVGGMAYSTTNIAKQYYDVEVGTYQSGYEETMKVGLMYVSDYGYAASPSYWTTELYNYEPSKSSNWLAGLNEWTISRSSDRIHSAFRVGQAGFIDIDNDNYYVDYEQDVRPTFYLKANISYVSGTGTESDPYRIS